ncbi:MerR family transcriptional regulator (plasmid) [Deinococcus sp. KNUC1210]|uniref:MerR family transcriptional regulator n=1 Tax=Deinococcus sp. KNUC1210 TaxID=2917691 RepID=UPI001EEFE716|nr:MerR family transcriptional regulator [Deinococcus sp. KNUC1210]ULH18310.1 MerR family transcriptional regulator [Deinococcus sp. KNUC1210]
MNSVMRIGELAARAGVTPRTIRYYESLGLLPPGEREGNGHHHYAEVMVTRLQKIDQLKRLGLSLEEIGEVIDLYFSDPSGIQPKRTVLGMLRRHLAETDAKLGELQQFRADLLSHIARFERFLETGELS